VAGQSIPRFDLYAVLGVEPSADTETIEAAYRDFMERHGTGAGGSPDRPIVRARVAHLWLTDSERRSRYDASRARAAARDAARDAAKAAPLAADGQPDEDDTIPWPAADLARSEGVAERPEAGIAWSSTPPEARGGRAGAPRRSRRRPGGLLGWAALIAAAVVVAVFVFSRFGTSDIADRRSASPPATVHVDPTPSPAPSPTPELTIPPTEAPPTPAATDLPVAAFQQGAWDTLQALIAASEAGDVATAQTMLGDTAPGLRASGLRRAGFPVVAAPAEIDLTQEGAAWVGTLTDGSRMTSPDGTTWTFDYDQRPLAAYRSPSTEPVHDLWWSDGKGKHHVYLRVALATISRTGVIVSLRWTFDPSQPNDATYFDAAALRISLLTFDDVAIPVTADAADMGGLTSVVAAASFTDAGTVPRSLGVVIVVTPDGSAGRENETTFTLTVR